MPERVDEVNDGEAMNRRQLDDERFFDAFRDRQLKKNFFRRRQRRRRRQCRRRR